MPNSNQDKIISRIQKMLAIANDKAVGNEHERETAMSQVLNLLAKHNISMSEVQSNEEKEDRDILEIAEEFPCPWRRTLAHAIAALYFCRFFFQKIDGKQKYKFTFVGLESNVITAKEMTQYLIKSVYKESIRLRKEKNESVAYETTFRNTAAERIAERCQILREEAEKDIQAEQPVSGSTALTLSSLYKQESEANENYIKTILNIDITIKKNLPQFKSRAGIKDGYQYGDKVNLNKQISQNKPNTLMITHK